MALTSFVPRDAGLNIIGGSFIANFGLPTPGKYDFTNYVNGAGVKVNAQVELGLYLRPNYLYFFHQLNFSLSIDSGVYLRAIDPGSTPKLIIKEDSNRSIFNAPIKLFKYFDNSAVDFYYKNLKSKAKVLADFDCILIQVPELVGIGTIYGQISLTVYEIMNETFIRQYERGEQIADWQRTFGKRLPPGILPKT